MKYDTKLQLEQLCGVLSIPGLPEPFGHDFHWYGGRHFDLVGTINADKAETIGPWGANPLKIPKVSVGDHRFVGYYAFEDIIPSEPTATEPK